MSWPWCCIHEARRPANATAAGRAPHAERWNPAALRALITRGGPMPRIARTLGLAFGLAGGLAASRGPEFAQQYRQRLGGAVDELRRVVERFDADAQGAGHTREGAITQLQGNPDRLASAQADAAR